MRQGIGCKLLRHPENHNQPNRKKGKQDNIMIRKIIERVGFDKYLSSKYFSAWFILIIDTCISALATGCVYLIIRGLFPNPAYSIRYGLGLMFLAGAVSCISFVLFRTFRSVIRHSTLREVWKLVAATILKDCILLGCILLFPKQYSEGETLAMGMMLDLLLTIFMLVTLRLALIVIYEKLKGRFAHSSQCKQVLIYGTDEKQIAASLRLQNSPHYRILGFLTFGEVLRRYTIAEHPVYFFENKESISYLIRKLNLDAILFATSASVRDERERLIKICTEVGVQVLILPPVDEVIGGKLMKQSIREIRIEDLLGRPEIQLSLDEIHANFHNKTVMVTGAAGSIGSELCRQIATFGVTRLILFDNAETPMHNIRLELEERFPNLEFIPVVGDVRIPLRLEGVFRTYQPQVVFHAAAYKHVPLMEENPCEAVFVNVAGTRNVADLCLRYNVEKMVMISTDKAVNPTNVMGASKRLAEIYVQSLGQAIASGKIEGRTRYVTTRFGNVLGSNGSVIPRFRQQIEKGGPVTVTHPDIMRFFMTIPEACRLVMEAATMSNGNEIFVFDMGEAVKIVDLASRMIQLAGFHVGGADGIEITYTGLRPGEKLYEEVLSDCENTKPTTHEKIRIAQVREYDYKEAQDAVDKLEMLARTTDVNDTVRMMKHIVPEFKSKNSRFEIYDKKCN